MAAWRTLFICRVKASITSPAFFVADSTAALRVATFLADGDGRKFLAFVGAEEILSFTQNIGVESAGQPALSRQNDGQNSLFRPVRQQRVLGLVDAGHDGT